MRIWKIEGSDLDRFLRKFEGEPKPRYVRVANDGSTFKMKVNELEWSAPLGFLEVERPEPALIVSPADHLYEKCDGCHFFVEASDPRDVEGGAASYVHNTRGTELDDLMACDEARPSGRKANLLTWKTYGPLAMRERFTS